MVSTGSEDITEVWEVGIIRQGRGEVGVLQDALLSHPATTRPLPMLTSRSVTHPLILQSAPRFFFWSLSLVFLVTHSGGQTRQNPREGGGGENRRESLL